ncbi:hypothetical protein ccbrp13_05650 [Ktedonobacteria bacterium brp13]|nr:hypothetical protein ccbrp13_05650 [Ktedonobacteria bacterium brp13]
MLMNARHSDQLNIGPNLVGYTMYHNDAFHHLQINGRLVKLSPTEYMLCMRLFRHFEWLQHFTSSQHDNWKAEMPNVYVSFAELQECAHLSERLHVTKHLSNANGKLRVHGITIICVGDYGYTLNFQRWTDLPMRETM